MERETLLTILLLLLGGLAAQPLAMLPHRKHPDEAPQPAEHRAWLRLWLPVVPTLLVVAWLCGWALREPDPVHDRFNHAMLILACLPFAAIVLRAVFRAVHTLVCEPANLPICTVGLLQPRVVFSPFLARALDGRQVRAAWEHERAHVRHRDPLRIWLAQLTTDLQWPWPGARARFDTWLEVLEHARDDEARERGVAGADLAAVVLAVARQATPARSSQGARTTIEASLLGNAQSLRMRITRLLSPLPDTGVTTRTGAKSGNSAIIATLATMLLIAGALGAVYGEWILHAALLWTRTV